MISAREVKQLREKTGAGMMESKAALEKAGGDAKAAEEILRKKGQLKAGKKSERPTGQGIIDAYIHGEGRIGVLVEVNCETDFVARNKDFKTLVHDLALHIAAASPYYISREDVPEEMIEKEKEICLLEQPFVRDADITVQELINQKIAILGENIRVKRFVRYALGE